MKGTLLHGLIIPIAITIGTALVAMAFVLAGEYYHWWDGKPVWLGGILGGVPVGIAIVASYSYQAWWLGRQ